MSKAAMIVACLLIAALVVGACTYLGSPANPPANPIAPRAEVKKTSVLTLKQKALAVRDKAEIAAASVRTTLSPYEEYKAKKACYEEEELKHSIVIGKTEPDIPLACSDTPPTRIELSKLLERAARQGDQAAQVEYAVDPLIEEGPEELEQLDRLRAWRDSAMAYLQAAVDRQDAKAILDVASAYDPLQCEASNQATCPSPNLQAIVTKDAAAAYRYFYQATLLGNAPAWIQAEQSTLEQYLTPDQITAAKAEARRALDLHPARPPSP